MNRRNYLTTIGASFSTLPALSSNQDRDADDDSIDYPPVYYTVTLPTTNTKLIHISVPDDLFDTATQLRLRYDNGSPYGFNITDSTADGDGWTLRNYRVPYHTVDSVTVDGVQAKQWDSLEFDRAALYYPSRRVVGVHAETAVVSVQTPEWECVREVDTYAESAVPTADPSQIQVWTQTDGEEVKVPLFPVAES